MRKSKLQFKIKNYLKSKKWLSIFFVDSGKFVGSDRNRGFTLIETMVALTIFSLSIVGMIVATSQGFANTSLAKSRLIASYLAQEGIEVVRNVRDSEGWDGLTLNNERISALQDQIFDNDNIVTPFRRRVDITSTGTEAKVISKVSWRQGQVDREIIFSETLFNWQKRLAASD